MQEYSPGQACLIAGSAVSACLAIALSHPEPQEIRGPLEIAPQEVELGRVRQGEIYPAEFHIRNTSDSVVRIAAVRGSYSCTSHSLSSDEILPGQSALLTLTLETGATRGSIGSVAKIYYFTESEIEGVKRRDLHAADCYLRCHVDPNIDVTPEVLTFNHRQSATQTVVLRPHMIGRFRVLDVGCSHAAFSAMIEDQDPTDVPCRVLVAFNPERWSGESTNAVLTIKTDDPVVPLLQVAMHVDHVDGSDSPKGAR